MKNILKLQEIENGNRIVSDDTKEERDLTERFQKIDAVIVESNAKT